MMKSALNLEYLTKIDKTSSDILREIARRLDGRRSAYIDYKDIARALDIDRDTVRKAVNRMKVNRIITVENGGLSIPGLVFSNA